MPPMFLAYFDESGDPGPKGPTQFFVLSCALIHDSHWLTALDELVLLRRNLKARLGLPVRVEIKSTHFRSGEGPFHGLGIGRRNRMNIFKDVMDYQANALTATTFAVAIDKRGKRAIPDARRGGPDASGGACRDAA